VQPHVGDERADRDADDDTAADGVDLVRAERARISVVGAVTALAMVVEVMATVSLAV